MGYKDTKIQNGREGGCDPDESAGDPKGCRSPQMETRVKGEERFGRLSILFLATAAGTREPEFVEPSRRAS